MSEEKAPLQLLNMRGGHLASLLFGIWVLISVTVAAAAAATYFVMAEHIKREEQTPTRASESPPIVIKTEAAPQKPPQLFVFLPGDKGTKTIRVEGINPATWPDEVRIKLSDMEALKAVLKELKPPDPPKAAPSKKKATGAASTQVGKTEGDSEWLPPPRDVVPPR